MTEDEFCQVYLRRVSTRASATSGCGVPNGPNGCGPAVRSASDIGRWTRSEVELVSFEGVPSKPPLGNALAWAT